MACPGNCTIHGSCFHGRCLCEGLRSGRDCEVDYAGQLGRVSLVSVALGTAIANVLVLVLISFILQRRCRRIEHRWSFTAPVWAMLLLIPGCLLRIVEFGIQPETMGTWIPRLVEVAVFSLPFLLIAAAYVIVMLFFLKTGMGRVADEAGRRTAARLRTGLVVALTSLAATAVGARAAFLTGISGHIMYVLHNVVLAVFVLVIAGGFLYFGRILLSRVENPQYRSRVHRFMLASGAFAAVAVAVLVVYNVSHAIEEPVAWLAMQSVLRACEVGLAVVLVLTFRPPPRHRQRSTDAVRFAVAGRAPLAGRLDSQSLLNFATEDNIHGF